MFQPGETIIHEFVIPFVAAETDFVIVSYKQKDNIVFERKVLGSELTDITVGESSKFSIEFTQQESLLFQDDMKYTIQLNVYAGSGGRYTSKIIKSTSGIQYLREVISNG